MFNNDGEKHGFNLVISVKELRERLTKRADVHLKRAAFYEEKADDFRDDVEKIPQGIENSTLGRHEDQLVRSKAWHLRLDRMLRFYADHLPSGDTVVLTRVDIEELELLELVEA